MSPFEEIRLIRLMDPKDQAEFALSLAERLARAAHEIRHAKVQVVTRDEDQGKAQPAHRAWCAEELQKTIAQAEEIGRDKIQTPTPGPRTTEWHRNRKPSSVRTWFARFFRR